MNYIYKIVNKINGKIYIGKTTYTITHRWIQHISAATTNKEQKDYNYLLHKAIRKYGIKNFIIEVIEEIEDENQLSLREIYWINYYNSCILEENSNGYNMTYGGEGTSKINKQEIFDLWDKGFGSLKIAKQTGHTSLSIKKILETFKNYSKEIDFARNTGNTVFQYDENGKLINSYPSISYAARQVGVNSSIINKCCHGEKQSAAGFFWSFNPKEKFEPKKLKTWHTYKIGQYTLENELIHKYDSLSEAIHAMKKKQPKYIKECCEGKRKEMYGFIWKYL